MNLCLSLILNPKVKLHCLENCVIIRDGRKVLKLVGGTQKFEGE